MMRPISDSLGGNLLICSRLFASLSRHPWPGLALDGGLLVYECEGIEFNPGNCKRRPWFGQHDQASTRTSIPMDVVTGIGGDVHRVSRDDAGNKRVGVSSVEDGYDAVPRASQDV